MEVASIKMAGDGTRMPALRCSIEYSAVATRPPRKYLRAPSDGYLVTTCTADAAISHLRTLGEWLQGLASRGTLQGWMAMTQR